jgi:NADH-quinone oxidoreductase subunit L
VVTHVLGTVVPTVSPTAAMKLIWLVPSIPLIAAAVNLFVGRRLGRGAGWLAVGAMVASFLLATAAVLGLHGLPPGSRLYILRLFDWIQVGTFNVGVDLRPR